MATRYDINDVRLTRRPTAVMRGEMPASEVPMWLANCYRTVHSYLRSVGMDPAGPPFARFTFLGQDVAVQARLSCRRGIEGGGGLQPSPPPAGPPAPQAPPRRHPSLGDAVGARIVERHDLLLEEGVQALGVNRVGGLGQRADAAAAYASTRKALDHLAADVFFDELGRRPARRQGCRGPRLQSRPGAVGGRAAHRRAGGVR